MTTDTLRLADQAVDMTRQFTTPSHERGVLHGCAQELRRLAAVEAERDQLRERVEALLNDSLTRVMAANEDELNAALKLDGKDPQDTARLAEQALQIATLKHERDQLQAEVEALRWQPIETAPKDGTHILLANQAGTSEGGWLSDVDHGADWEGQLGMAGWWRADGTDWPNTHWRPLPTPPAA